MSRGLPTTAKGRAGETVAADHLQAAGFRIATRNWRSRFGEVDLVAVRRDLWVFVEVKTRRSQRFGSGAASVTPTKQKRILQAARLYLAKHGSGRERIRFDVIEVAPGPDDTLVVQHWYEGAFSSDIAGP